jgi:hypothetical protein
MTRNRMAFRFSQDGSRNIRFKDTRRVVNLCPVRKTAGLVVREGNRSFSPKNLSW